MRKSMFSRTPRLARAGLAAGAATAVLVAATAAPALAASILLTLSQSSGPSGGLNTITATATTATASTAPFTAAVDFNAGVNPAVVQFQTRGTSTTCTATYTAPVGITVTNAVPPVQTVGTLAVPPANVKKMSTTKLAITVPATVILTNNTATPTPAKPASVTYNICVYAGSTTGVAPTGSPLIANAAYTIAGRPTITAVTPLSGPALGETEITVTGTGFATGTGTSATIGGTPLKSVVVAASGLSFTAITPAHIAGEDQVIVVTSTGGRVNSDDPDNLNDGGTEFLYSFSNGLQVTPNTAPGVYLPATTGSVDLDIQGVGFLGLTFNNVGGTSSLAPSAHIYLVDGVYDPAEDTGAKTVGPIAECRSVLTISDNEVICTINMANSLDAAGAVAVGTAVPDGAYTVAIVSNGAIDADTTVETPTDLIYSKSEITSTATFTVAPY